MLTHLLISIPVFHTDLMVADSESFSPSPAKPRAVAASLSTLTIPLEFHNPEAATADELKRAHEPRPIDDVLSFRRTHGFGNRSVAKTRSLPELVRPCAVSLGSTRPAPTRPSWTRQGDGLPRDDLNE